MINGYERCDGEFEIVDEYVGINTEEDLANMDISREMELLFGKED